MTNLKAEYYSWRYFLCLLADCHCMACLQNAMVLEKNRRVWAEVTEKLGFIDVTTIAQVMASDFLTTTISTEIKTFLLASC